MGLRTHVSLFHGVEVIDESRIYEAVIIYLESYQVGMIAGVEKCIR